MLTKTFPCPPRRNACWAILILNCTLVSLVAGCDQPTISRYQVPKPPSTAQRLLGAVVVVGDQTWFFKLFGSKATIDAQVDDFDLYLKSIQFKDNKPVWELPRAWEQKPGSGMRFATIVLGPKADPVELTVTPLGGEAGSLLANVNRWRGQMGLPDTTDDGLKKITKTVEIAGKTFTLVDMEKEGAAGALPGNHPPIPGGGTVRPPVPPGGGNAPPAAPVEPTYELPKGWSRSAQVQFAAVALEVAEGKELAKITVSPLSGPAGGLSFNVNRWRGQVGLPELKEADLNREILSIPVGDLQGKYVVLPGPESDGPNRKQILGVVVPQKDTTWFIKMTGPATLVGKQKTAFEQFVKSLRLEGGKGANP